MPEWTTFAGFAGVVLALLLILARASQASFGPGADATHEFSATGDERATPPTAGSQVGPHSASETGTGESPTVATAEPSPVDAGESPTLDTGESLTSAPETPSSGNSDPVFSGATGPARAASNPTLSTTSLLVNVAVSQGAFGVLLLAGAWFSQIPPSAFGVSGATLGVGSLLLGLAVGVALYVANEVGAALGDRVGLGRSEEVRALLTPDTRLGWTALLFVVLPLIAGFEELLFRGALIGVLAAGFGVSPWLLAAVSSVAFALGHGAQGPAGIVVTGVLGFALAATFVVTGSLLVVIVAHYLVNALEFVVHEGLDVEWV